MTCRWLLGLVIGVLLPTWSGAQEPTPPKAPDTPRHRPLIELFTSQG